MAWSALGTTFAMVGFLGVVGYGGYVLSENDDVKRSERLCQPVRDIRDFSLSAFNLIDREKEGKIKLFLQLDDYIHTDVCANYGARFFFGDQAADTYISYDHFRESLYKIPLSKAEISFVLQTGWDSSIDWNSDMETKALLSEYLEFKKLTGGAPTVLEEGE
jgi:hypothetical protein